jgi:hypothetical protein
LLEILNAAAELKSTSCPVIRIGASATAGSTTDSTPARPSAESAAGTSGRLRRVGVPVAVVMRRWILGRPFGHEGISLSRMGAARPRHCGARSAGTASPSSALVRLLYI